MAKKELNFGKLSLPTKAVIIKKEDDAAPMIEKAIEKIHGDAAVSKVLVAPIVVQEVASIVTIVEEPIVEISKKTAPIKKAEVIELDEMMPVKKISMDLPLDVYKYLKINSFDRAMTMKDYVLRLIEADMKRAKK